LQINVKQIIALLIFIGFIALIEYYFGWQQILSPWRRVSWYSIGITLVLTFVSYWIRAMRLFNYFHADMNGMFPLCFKLMLQHNLLNNLLPMRTGEVSFPVLMKRYFNVPVIRSVPVLFLFRVIDLHTLLALALLAAGQLWLNNIFATTGLFIVWMFIPWVLYWMHNVLLQKLGDHPNGKGRIFLQEILVSLPNNVRAFWHAIAWTWINWAVKLAVFTWVLLLFLDTDFTTAWLATIAGDLTSVLPIYGVAGAGTYEAGVVSALLPFKVETNQAVQAAVNLHLFILGSTFIGGAVAVLFPARKQHG
jgi:uncharacterized membrane protein YbhN (UPF0104 family)